MFYQPQSITNEIFNELEQAFENNQRDPFTIIRLKHEAEKLLRVDSASAYMVMGTIAVLEENIEATHKNYKKAINIDPNNLIILTNYIKSLLKLGYFSEATKVIQPIFDKHFDLSIPDYVDIVLTYSFAGRFRDAQKLITTLHQQSFNNEDFSSIISVNDFATNNIISINDFAINNFVDFMDERNITDSEFESLINITMSTLHQHDIYIPGNQVLMSLSDEDGESAYFSYRIKMNKPVDEVVRLNFELDDRIVDECSDKIINSHIVPIYIATEE